MSEVEPISVESSEHSATDNLQFDQAEYQAPVDQLKCANCQQPIGDAYYAMNGFVLCDPCRQTVRASLTGGSQLRRLLRASLFGSVAAIAGFILYFGVLKLTGYEIGLISIAVGLMVGVAVRAGSDQRGGWVFQGLAMLLTYAAIAASYSVLVIPQVMAQLKDKAATEAEADPKSIGPGEAVAPDAEVEFTPKDLTPSEWIIGVAALLGLLAALPIIVGFEQPIGLLIIGFALYEAWKINRRVPLEITGPHPVGQQLTPAGVAGHA